MTETDPLKRLYRRLRDNVTEGVAGDVMQMPPSWGELLTAVHEAAFPDGDEEPEPLTVPEPVAVTSGTEAAERMEYAEGWGDGYAEGHAEGYRDAVLRLTGGTEAAKRMEYAEGWGDGYAEGHAEGYRDAVLRLTDGGEA